MAGKGPDHLELRTVPHEGRESASEFYAERRRFSLLTEDEYREMLSFAQMSTRATFLRNKLRDALDSQDHMCADLLSGLSVTEEALKHVEEDRIEVVRENFRAFQGDYGPTIRFLEELQSPELLSRSLRDALNPDITPPKEFGRPMPRRVVYADGAAHIEEPDVEGEYASDREMRNHVISLRDGTRIDLRDRIVPRLTVGQCMREVAQRETMSEKFVAEFVQEQSDQDIAAMEREYVMHPDQYAFFPFVQALHIHTKINGGSIDNHGQKIDVPALMLSLRDAVGTIFELPQEGRTNDEISRRIQRLREIPSEELRAMEADFMNGDTGLANFPYLASIRELLPLHTAPAISETPPAVTGGAADTEQLRAVLREAQLRERNLSQELGRVLRTLDERNMEIERLKERGGLTRLCQKVDSTVRPYVWGAIDRLARRWPNRFLGASAGAAAILYLFDDGFRTAVDATLSGVTPGGDASPAPLNEPEHVAQPHIDDHALPRSVEPGPELTVRDTAPVALPEMPPQFTPVDVLSSGAARHGFHGLVNVDQLANTGIGDLSTNARNQLANTLYGVFQNTDWWRELVTGQMAPGKFPDRGDVNLNILMNPDVAAAIQAAIQEGGAATARLRQELSGLGTDFLGLFTRHR